MAEQELFEALNACIDRMNAGESLDDCLRDYPELDKRLRPLLETGMKVYEAQASETEVSEVQQQVSAGVQEALRRKQARERQGGMRPNRKFVMLGAAASIALVFIFALVFLSSIYKPSMEVLLVTFPVETSPTPIDAINPTAFANASETAVANISIAQAATVGAGFGSTVAAVNTETFTGSTTAIPAGIGTATPEAIIGAGTGMTMTAVAPIAGTPIPTQFRATMALPTATARTLGPASDTYLTATPLVALSTPTMVPIYPTEVPGTPGIVSTSVALMSPAPTQVAAMMTATLAPTTTMTPTGTFTPTGTLPPTWTPSSELTVTAQAQGTYSPTMPPPTQPASLATPVQIIPLNAGEIDDNANWDRYLQYRQNFLPQYGQMVHDVDVTGRQIITVMDEQGLPILGARVRVYAGQTLVSETQTYATGKTLFFPKANPQMANTQSFLVMVDKGNAAARFTLNPSQGPNWAVTLSQAPMDRQHVKLDVLFLLDATGSMGDEISQLQNNLLGISAEIAALPGSIDVRYGLVEYRDRGDEFVTRVYDFTPDVGTFQGILNTVQADGGGDTPESLNEGLHQAVQGVSWRGDDTVKLVFLVADAPPHLDYANDFDYRQEMMVATQRGIKIHPIASSGLSPDGEYIFRQIAEYTMGHFLFLTYQQGTAGAPGEARSDLQVGTPSNPQKQQQGDYTVQQLDKLVLQLIKDELAALNQRVTAETSPVAVSVSLPSNTPPPTTDVVQTVPTTTGEIGVTSGLNVPFLLVVIGLSIMIGYTLRRGAGYMEKRKRGEW